MKTSLASAEIIPFRRRLKEPFVWSDDRAQDECTEVVHVFDSIPGRCMCGEHSWDKPLPPELEDALA